MTRSSRLVVPGLPLHIVQRGVNRQDIFPAESDYRRFLRLMERALERYPCSIHAYALMTNHVHLLLTPTSPSSASRFMKHVGQQYAQALNEACTRTGALFEGRFRSSVVESERYFLQCQRYIELNPVRAGLVRRPGDYMWSSYRANAQGVADPLIIPHPQYLGLAGTWEERRRVYRAFFGTSPALDEMDRIRKAVNSNVALGSDRFVDALETSQGRRARVLRRGRKPITAAM